MDEEKAETASFATLQKELQAIDQIDGSRPLARRVAELHREGARPFFGFASRQDFRDASQVIGGVDQGGLGLPDRDYYFRDDKKSQELRALYQDHVGRMLSMAGDSRAAVHARRIFQMETELAKASLDRVARRDPNKIYHRLDRSGLLTTAPHFEWNDYFATIGAADVQAINVTAPEFFRALDSLLARSRLDDVRVYLKWRALEAAADALGRRFVEERFRYTRAHTGAKAILPRWKRCVQMTDRALGEALGRTFVVTTVGDGGQGDGEGDDPQHREGVRDEPGRPLVDGRRRRSRRRRQAAQDRQQGRLPGEVARLRRSSPSARSRRWRTCSARRASRPRAIWPRSASPSTGTSGR